ncbi:hypothetical protein SBA3_3140030 [Candidatus Sulfopaludibacter sp. SbA3]|nr:hypothetical protein SBA3_3140030 [Candidatus Sulfopaludibacter sp. SbA3]
MDVTLRAATALGNRNDVVKLETRTATALHAASAVPAPHVRANTLRYSRPLWGRVGSLGTSALPTRISTVFQSANELLDMRSDLAIWHWVFAPHVHGLASTEPNSEPLISLWDF